MEMIRAPSPRALGLRVPTVLTRDKKRQLDCTMGIRHSGSRGLTTKRRICVSCPKQDLISVYCRCLKRAKDLDKVDFEQRRQATKKTGQRNAVVPRKVQGSNGAYRGDSRTGKSVPK